MKARWWLLLAGAAWVMIFVFWPTVKDDASRYALKEPRESARAQPIYPTKTTVVPIDSTILKKCDRLVRDCVREGVLGKIIYSDISKVVVRSRFWDLEYDEKRGVALALSYCAKAEGFDGHVKLLDAYTNKEVGMLNALTNGLTLR